MRRKPEWRQLLSVKSMIRYRPPKGTAGFALSAVNGCNREPIPPARMILIVLSSMPTSGLIGPSLARFERKFNRSCARVDSLNSRGGLERVNQLDRKQTPLLS